MRAADLRVAGGAALTTLVAGFLALSPTWVTAGAPALRAEVSRPVLAAEGLEVSVKPLADKVGAGEAPVISVTIQNKGARTARVPVHLAMRRAAFSQPMARMAPIPVEVWKHQLDVNLARGEKKSFVLVTGAKLARGDSASFSARIGKQSRDLASVYTDPPAQGLELLLAPMPWAADPVAQANR